MREIVLSLVLGDSRPNSRTRVATGPKPKLEPHRDAIRTAIRNNPDVTLNELRSQLKLPGCLQTLANALHRWGLALKKSAAGRRTATA